MDSPISIIRQCGIGIAIGITVLIIAFSLLSYDSRHTDREHTPQTKSGFSLPARLVIPSIHMNAPLESVGLTHDGTLDVPRGILNAGWYNLGAIPGEHGTAVIDGHYGWIYGKPAVFNALSTLRAGNKISTVDTNGATATFVVRELREYDPNASTKEIFVSNDEKSHLNLITCKGTWSEADQTYSNRLVVFSDRVSE